MKHLLVLYLLLSTNLIANASVYTISSAAALSALRLRPGDTVMLRPGNWISQQLVFKATGSEKAPIVLMAAQAGKVVLQGSSSLKMEGTWLVANGLLFTNGYAGKNDVIVLAPGSSWCRLTNTAIVNYSNPGKKDENKWISVHGAHNRVDHCYLEGKTNAGATLVVWRPDSTPNYHRIDHNFFGGRPELGENGGETIRIGTSHQSLSNSYTLVEQNYFRHCDGEIEIISNKSCRNTIRYNTFFECRGTLTLRHGNYSQVYGNRFNGNGLPATGGIRITGEGHIVCGNRLENLRGTGLNAAISIMDGLPQPALSSHWQVKNAIISGNTIIQCSEALAIGAGKNEKRNLPPENCSITANQVSNSAVVVKWYDDAARKNIRFAANMVNSVETGTQGNNIPEPFITQSTESPLWYREPDCHGQEPDKDIGPSWWPDV